MSCQEADLKAREVCSFPAYKKHNQRAICPHRLWWGLTGNSIKCNLQIETFVSVVQERVLLKIYYAYELLAYDYSKQNGSKLFSRMYLKWVCTLRVLKCRHCLEGSQWPATLFGMSFKVWARDLCLGIFLSIPVWHENRQWPDYSKVISWGDTEFWVCYVCFQMMLCECDGDSWCVCTGDQCVCTGVAHLHNLFTVPQPHSWRNFQPPSWHNSIRFHCLGEMSLQWVPLRPLSCRTLGYSPMLPFSGEPTLEPRKQQHVLEAGPVHTSLLLRSWKEKDFRFCSLRRQNTQPFLALTIPPCPDPSPPGSAAHQPIFIKSFGGLALPIK